MEGLNLKQFNFSLNSILKLKPLSEVTETEYTPWPWVSVGGNYSNPYRSTCGSGQQILNDHTLMKTYIYTKPCMWMFMLTLFLQPVHEKSAVQMMNRRTIKDMHTMEYYWGIKMNLVLIHAIPWTNLGDTMLFQKQTQKATNYTITLTWNV